jgi:AraC-like DNA-binding protein
LAGALTFTTRGVPGSDRRRVLHTLADLGLLPIEPLSDAARVEVTKWRLPGASVLWGRFDQIRQRAEAGDADDLFFGINASGVGLVRQRGHQAAVNPGEAVVLRPAVGPFTVLRPAPSTLIGIRAPRRALALDAGRHDEAPQLVQGHTPALRLLTAYLAALRAGPAPAPELADAVVEHLLQLIALSVRPRDPSPIADRAVRAARLAALKADIARHFGDPALSVGAVAARHGISPRYVHKLFEDDGRTYSEFVLDVRLERARKVLRDPRAATRTVGAIAGSVGFGDLSYFNRTFRRRYGMTPTEARRRTR